MEPARAGAPGRNPVRRLYDWTLRWAQRPWGGLALFLIAIVEASVFPIPPDALLLALGVAAPRRAVLFGGLATLGSVLGGVLGYLLGALIGGWTIGTLVSREEIHHVGEMFRNNAFLAVLASAMTPIPYKVFTIGAGFFAIDFPTFVTAGFLGRGLRFMGIGALLLAFGPRIRPWIERHLEWVVILAAALLIGGILLMRWWLR